MSISDAEKGCTCNRKLVIVKNGKKPYYHRQYVVGCPVHNKSGICYE